MLEELDKVPWDRLSHAYDYATDVPEAIRHLANDDEEKYERAMEVLWNHLFHQGTIDDFLFFLFVFLDFLFFNASGAEAQRETS